MPMYLWQDKETGLEIEVLRPFSEYEEPPSEEELPIAEQGKKRDWVRLINTAPHVTRAPGFGKKGYW